MRSPTCTASLTWSGLLCPAKAFKREPDPGGQVQVQPDRSVVQVLTEQFPDSLQAGLAVGDDHDVVGPAHDQCGHVEAAHLTDDGLEELLVEAIARPSGGDDDAVGPLGVVPQSMRGCLDCGFVRAREQLLGEIALAAQFGFGDALQPGEFHAQHGRGVFERGQVGMVRRARGVDKRDDAEDAGPRVGQDQPGPAVVERLAGDLQLADELLPLSGCSLARRWLGTSPAAAGIAVHVLEDREQKFLFAG